MLTDKERKEYLSPMRGNVKLVKELRGRSNLNAEQRGNSILSQVLHTLYGWRQGYILV